MDVQLNIPYEKLIELVEQLPVDKQQDLLNHLIENTKTHPLSKQEKKALFHRSILSTPLNEAPSVRREDWYGDDGR